MSIRFIADYHLFDTQTQEWRKDLRLSQSKYADFIISNWNKVVSDEDTTIIVGDVGTCCDRTFNVLKSLRGTKILIIGNHDVCWGRHLYDPCLFNGTHECVLFNGILLKHIPDYTECQEELKRAQYLVHGHHHTYEPANMYRSLLEYSQDVHRLNCCADLVGHTPRTLNELIVSKEKLLEQYRERGVLKEVHNGRSKIC